jgi:Na+-translocating ferredoxin:NAD+ oxidoreductase RnfD subunit
MTKIIVALLSAVCAVGVGCAVFNKPGTNTLDPQKVAIVVKNLASYGVAYAVKQNPQLRGVFQASADGLTSLISSNQLTADDVNRVLASLSNTTPVASIYIVTAVDAYNIFFSEAVAAKLSNEDIKIVLTALRDGIVFGLQTPTEVQLKTSPGGMVEAPPPTIRYLPSQHAD